MKRQEIHVVPAGDRWAVKPAGSPTPVSTHRTQAAATDAGRRLARSNETELVIHSANGRIRDKDSYGRDPFPPRDKQH